MKYFIDTEFSERGPGYPIQLISIAVVAEDGTYIYAENRDCDWGACNPWVHANVFPHLTGPRNTLAEIASLIRGFVDGDKPEFWGYYADYDWVVFCQIFGSMIDLPKGWPMYCRDLKQWCDMLGNPELPKQESTEHNALSDALWNRQVWGFLHAYERDSHDPEQ